MVIELERIVELGKTTGRVRDARHAFRKADAPRRSYSRRALSHEF